jgi:hypothetical protein
MLHVAPIPSLFAILSKKESVIDIEIEFRFCVQKCVVFYMFSVPGIRKTTKKSCHLKTNPTDPVGSNELKDSVVRKPLVS